MSPWLTRAGWRALVAAAIAVAGLGVWMAINAPYEERGRAFIFIPGYYIVWFFQCVAVVLAVVFTSAVRLTAGWRSANRHITARTREAVKPPRKIATYSAAGTAIAGVTCALLMLSDVGRFKPFEFGWFALLAGCCAPPLLLAGALIWPWTSFRGFRWLAVSSGFVVALGVAGVIIGELVPVILQGLIAVAAVAVSLTLWWRDVRIRQPGIDPEPALG